MMFKISSLQTLLWITILGSTLFEQTRSSQTGCRCFPGDSCWPSTAEWSVFNKTIHGRLIATIPIASVCHHDSFATYDAAKCAQLQDDWLLPETHFTSSSSIMGQYFANASCDPFSAPSAQCVLGTYVQYAVNATNEDDFRKTMAFATARNIRFLVRNTGHDYFGKSTGAGALALWTHNLKYTDFINYRSRSYNGKAMKMGAGVQTMEALSAAHLQGLVVAGGQCQSLAVGGGYTQGGGHSLMASVIGLSADQVLEWEVVTATGEYLVATPFLNTDLYWALSGGGGGTYAAVLSVTVKAYPDVKVAAANLTVVINANVSSDSFFWIVQTWLQNLPTIVDAGGVALWTLADGFFQIAPIFGPNLTVPALQNLLRPTLAALNQSGIPYSSSFSEYSTFLDAYNAMNPPQDVTDGNMGAYLFPRGLVTSESSASALTHVLRKLVTGTGVVSGGVSFNVARGQAITHPPANSVNPAWKHAIHYAAFGLPYNRTSLSANAAEYDLITNVYGPELDALVPGGMSSYLNEANPFDPNWKKVFYGVYYNRLLAIKEKYDPNSIFYGLTAVGSDRWEEQEDKRLCKIKD